MKTIYPIAFLLVLALTGCTSVQHISQVKVGYEVPGKQTDLASAATISQMIAPYKMQVDSKMNEVIAQLGTELTKKQPESTMGNWYIDAMMWGANTDGLHADLALCNYGGLRVPVITPGPLTMGEVFELSPFDNLLVIVEVPGIMLDSIFQHIATKDGWPVSSNVRLVISQKKLLQSWVDMKPVDPDKIYRVAVPDYVANGGDDTRWMIPLSRFQTTKLQRDIIIGYARESAKAGKEITASIEGRIISQ